MPARGWLACLALAFAGLAAVLPLQSSAAKLLVAVDSSKQGITPFISLVSAHMDDTSLLDHVQFTVSPKPGSLTRPVSARYSSNYLLGKGDIDETTGALTVPVFGLYQDFTNTVEIVFTFVDGTSQTNTLSIKTIRYNTTTNFGGTFDHPATVITPRTKDAALSYDFIEMKSGINTHSPTVIDTDGEIRWVGTTDDASVTVIFYGGSFYSAYYLPGTINTHTGAGPPGTTILRNDFDGTSTNIADYAAAGVTTFHHNFDFGKSGILTCTSTAEYTDSTIMEVDTSGNVLKNWNLATIISQAMTAGGDDPSQFVPAPGALTDWFHNNANTYRPSDNSLVVSSREDFVIALDYDTGAIKWILGDPTKQWYQFPSLRKYALKGTTGTHYPIGQHAVSFFRDDLLLFDDGYQSINHTPPGKSRTYSAPRKYSIPEGGDTATETWHYLADPPIFSPITSSVYEDAPGQYLIDYAVGGPYVFTELIGLLPNGDKAFDYKYNLVADVTCWNAVPIHLENLVFE